MGSKKHYNNIRELVDDFARRYFGRSSCPHFVKNKATATVALRIGGRFVEDLTLSLVEERSHGRRVCARTRIRAQIGRSVFHVRTMERLMCYVRLWVQEAHAAS